MKIRLLEAWQYNDLRHLIVGDEASTHAELTIVCKGKTKPLVDVEMLKAAVVEVIRREQ